MFQTLVESGMNLTPPGKRRQASSLAKPENYMFQILVDYGMNFTSPGMRFVWI